MQYNLQGVSPFGHPRIKACKAAPRGLSQPSTSFIGVLRQGILYVRLSNFLRYTESAERLTLFVIVQID